MGGVALGMAAAVIIVSALLSARRSSAAPKPVIPIKPVDPKKPDKPIDPNKPVIPGVIDVIIDPTPNPDPPNIIVDPVEPPAPKPDPYKPSPTPTPGQYFQAREGYWGEVMTRDCYGGAPRPAIAWMRVYAHALNQWIAYRPEVGWTGGINPKYSGWQTKFGSGHLYPVIYFPSREEIGT